VFRDAINIGPDNQPDDRKLALEDSYCPLLLMFDLMDNFGRRKRGKFNEHPSSAFVAIPKLADKYDILWLPWVMRGHLWEASTTYHSGWVIFIYEIAFKLEWRELALQAVRHLEDHSMPVDFSVEQARAIGVDGYHCLITAAQEADSEDWSDIADCLVLPEE
jgi:hypothetical protein